jgi:hypothetical protein
LQAPPLLTTVNLFNDIERTDTGMASYAEAGFA